MYLKDYHHFVICDMTGRYRGLMKVPRDRISSDAHTIEMKIGILIRMLEHDIKTVICSILV